jgi:hypothetical protein
MSDFDYAEQMAQQEQELAQYKLEEWRSAALEKHPGATPLKHLLLGTSPEAVEQLAKDVAESLAGQAQQEPTRQGPYVPAGTPAIYNETPDDRMQDIIQDAARRPQDERGWSSYLQAKFERAGVSYPGQR